jgi:hypothetical protein
MLTSRGWPVRCRDRPLWTGKPGRSAFDGKQWSCSFCIRLLQCGERKSGGQDACEPPGTCMDSTGKLPQCPLTVSGGGRHHVNKDLPPGLLPLLMAFQKPHGPATLGIYFRPDMCRTHGRKHGRSSCQASELPCPRLGASDGTAAFTCHTPQLAPPPKASPGSAPSRQFAAPIGASQLLCAETHSITCGLARFSHPKSQSWGLWGSPIFPGPNQMPAGDCATCLWLLPRLHRW